MVKQRCSAFINYNLIVSFTSSPVFVHGSDCKSNVYPYLWEIQIKHNGLNYQNPFQIVVLGFSYVRGNFVKIKKKKKYEFSFSIDFSKIGLVSKVYKFENYVSTVNKDSINEYYFNGKNNFKNFDYGEYSVKLLYKAIMKDKQTINSLESNIVNIEYREQMDKKTRRL